MRRVVTDRVRGRYIFWDHMPTGLCFCFSNRKNSVIYSLGVIISGTTRAPSMHTSLLYRIQRLNLATGAVRTYSIYLHVLTRTVQQQVSYVLQAAGMV